MVFQLLIYFRVGGWDSHWIMFIPLPHHTHTEILDGKRIPISVLHVLWVLHNQPMSVLSGLMEGSSLHVCLLLGSCWVWVSFSCGSGCRPLISTFMYSLAHWFNKYLRAFYTLGSFRIWVTAVNNIDSPFSRNLMLQWGKQKVGQHGWILISVWSIHQFNEYLSAFYMLLLSHFSHVWLFVTP